MDDPVIYSNLNHYFKLQNRKSVFYLSWLDED